MILVLSIVTLYLLGCSGLERSSVTWVLDHGMGLSSYRPWAVVAVVLVRYLSVIFLRILNVCWMQAGKRAVRMGYHRSDPGILPDFLLWTGMEHLELQAQVPGSLMIVPEWHWVVLGPSHH